MMMPATIPAMIPPNPHHMHCRRAIARSARTPASSTSRGLTASAAALVVADLADDIPAGIEMAAKSIDSNAAAEALKKLIDISNA